MQIDAYEASLLIPSKDRALISRDFRDRAQAGSGAPITIFNINSFEVEARLDLDESALRQLGALQNVQPVGPPMPDLREFYAFYNENYRT